MRGEGEGYLKWSRWCSPALMNVFCARRWTTIRLIIREGVGVDLLAYPLPDVSSGSTAGKETWRNAKKSVWTLPIKFLCYFPEGRLCVCNSENALSSKWTSHGWDKLAPCKVHCPPLSPNSLHQLFMVQKVGEEPGSQKTFSRWLCLKFNGIFSFIFSLPFRRVTFSCWTKGV